MRTQNTREEIFFGDWLRKQRRALDLSRHAFAHQVGCAEVTLRRIEAGTLKPSKELANILFVKLGIPESERPQWISFARGLSGFPVQSHSVSNKPITNLPAPITTFIGREKEQAEVIRLITKHRLVTLTGPGGVGKTRLSLKVSELKLGEFANGIWLAELASLRDPVFLSRAVASVFGIATQSGIRHVELLINFLQAKSILLILDNCEHLLDACAQLTDVLLKNCPQLKILATSRESLGITGEATYRVPSLGLPDVQQLLKKIRDYESVRLFEERAQLAQTDFALTLENASFIAQICHRLDGIPLAIELAAARVNVFPVQQIATRLNESFDLLTGGSRTALPRSQTIRASIDWSWNLLSNSERILLRCLSVFEGGWTLESAESVCFHYGIEKSDVLDLISLLVKKSLVIVKQLTGNNTRYRFHEVVRQYMHERLVEAGENVTLRNQHRDLFLDFVERAKPEIVRADQKMWINALEDEKHNVRTALSWSIENGNAEQALRFCLGLTIFWERHKHYLEAAQACQDTFSCVKQNESLKTTELYASILASSAFYIAVTEMILLSEPSVRAALEQAQKIYDAINDYNSTGPVLTSQLLIYMHLEKNDLSSAEQCVSRLSEKVKASGYQWGIALAKRSMAELSQKKGNIVSALALWQESYELFMQIGDVWAAIEVSRSLIWQKVMRGEFEDGMSLSKQNLLFYEEYGDPGGVADAYSALGKIAQEQGQYDSAKLYFTNALALGVEIGNPMGIVFAIERIAYLLYLQGKVEEAHAEYQAALTRLKDLPDDSSYGFFHARFAQINLNNNRLGEARKALTVGLEVLQKTEQKVDIYIAYYGFGELARLERHYSKAIENYCASLKAVRDGSLEIEIPRILDGIAKTEYLQSKLDKSARLFGAAEALRKQMGMVIHIVDRPEYDKHIELLKNKMSKAEFKSAQVEGAKMNFEEVYLYAMKKSK